MLAEFSHHSNYLYRLFSFTI